MDLFTKFCINKFSSFPTLYYGFPMIPSQQFGLLSTMDWGLYTMFLQFLIFSPKFQMSLGELFPSWSYELYTPKNIVIVCPISCCRTMNQRNSYYLQFCKLIISIKNTPLWELKPLAQHLRYL